MGVPRLDKIVANAVRGVVRRAARISGQRIADITDTRVRVAYVGMYDKYSLSIERKGILYLDSSDITNIVTSDFPNTIKSKGCVWVSNSIPWYARDKRNIAFRAELRKGRGDAKGKYLAMLWESTGDPNSCKVYYRTGTDYANFIPGRKIR